MTEELTVISERVDDIPVLLAQQERMGIQPLMDKHFVTHGNWEGFSLGRVAVGWLTHVLSQADHRLNHVQSWAAKRLETLGGCIQQPVRALDFSDDRLGSVLHALSNDERWDAFEGELNRHLLRVYELSAERARLDSTTVSGYWQITSDGLFQLGHSKGRQRGLPQVKVMLASLDPLGMPLVTDVLSGNRADDPLYIPSITRVRESVGRSGLLYVGDSKMASLYHINSPPPHPLVVLPETVFPSSVASLYHSNAPPPSPPELLATVFPLTAAALQYRSSPPPPSSLELSVMVFPLSVGSPYRTLNPPPFQSAALPEMVFPLSLASLLTRSSPPPKP